jgi:Secretory lipase
VVLNGHSEGGHAVLWAAELAPTYAPELQMLGVAASAPGAELAAGLRAEAAAGPATLTSGAMLLVVAWSDAYRVPLDVLTPAAARHLIGAYDGLPFKPRELPKNSAFLLGEVP